MPGFPERRAGLSSRPSGPLTRTPYQGLPPPPRWRRAGLGPFPCSRVGAVGGEGEDGKRGGRGFCWSSLLSSRLPPPPPIPTCVSGSRGRRLPRRLLIHWGPHSGPRWPSGQGHGPPIFQTALGRGPRGWARFKDGEGGAKRPGAGPEHARTRSPPLSPLLPRGAPVHPTLTSSARGHEAGCPRKVTGRPVWRAGAGAAGGTVRARGPCADVPSPWSCGTSRQAGKPREPPQPWHRGRVLLP